MSHSLLIFVTIYRAEKFEFFLGFDGFGCLFGNF
jgi:hypothetical protein